MSFQIRCFGWDVTFSDTKKTPYPRQARRWADMDLDDGKPDPTWKWKVHTLEKQCLDVRGTYITSMISGGETKNQWNPFIFGHLKRDPTSPPFTRIVGTRSLFCLGFVLKKNQTNVLEGSFIFGHKVRPFGRGPTTRFLGDENNHHGSTHCTSVFPGVVSCMTVTYVPWSKVAMGMVIPPLIGILLMGI